MTVSAAAVGGNAARTITVASGPHAAMCPPATTAVDPAFADTMAVSLAVALAAVSNLVPVHVTQGRGERRERRDRGVRRAR